MDKTTIVIGGRPAGEPLAEDLNDAEMADQELYRAMAPRGTFTSRGLAPIVKATNTLLPLFDQDPSYPKLEDTDVLPTDFVRILAMFTGAVEEAIASEVLRPEMAIDLGSVIDDSGLMTLAGKLSMLSKDRDFKRWLAEEQEDQEPEAEEEEMDSPSEDDIDALMMKRL